MYYLITNGKEYQITESTEDFESDTGWWIVDNSTKRVDLLITWNEYLIEENATLQEQSEQLEFQLRQKLIS